MSQEREDLLQDKASPSRIKRWTAASKQAGSSLVFMSFCLVKSFTTWFHLGLRCGNSDQPTWSEYLTLKTYTPQTDKCKDDFINASIQVCPFWSSFYYYQHFSEAAVMQCDGEGFIRCLWLNQSTWYTYCMSSSFSYFKPGWHIPPERSLSCSA